MNMYNTAIASYYVQMSTKYCRRLYKKIAIAQCVEFESVISEFKSYQCQYGVFSETKLFVRLLKKTFLGVPPKDEVLVPGNGILLFL